MAAPTPVLDLDLKPPPGGEVLYQSERCTLIWGDCTDPAVIAQVPDWYGLLCTDPPYGVNYRSNRGGNFKQISGDTGTTDWPGILAQWVGPEGTYTRGLANHRHVTVFGYTPEQLAGPLRLSATTEMVWDKDFIGMGDLTLPYGPGHERITFGVHVKQKSSRKEGDGALSARLRRGSVLRVPRPNGGAVKRHSNEKPWLLMADLIESSTLRGDLVVDPCAGSGSTGVAAVLRGRCAFLVEVDRDHAMTALARIKAAEKIANLLATA